MKKDGTIVVLDTNEEHCRLIHESVKAEGFKNNIVCFTNADEAGDYVKTNVPDIFIILQSTLTHALEIPHTRNMVYMHEKFDTDKIPYMFLLLHQRNPVDKAHTFVHTYYKPDEAGKQEDTLVAVISFWKDHVFPPKVNSMV